ncbi:hypothetical protein DFP72DRAFT_379531 [Ephemerocybe angulata]|uniref:C2H2-type domain-containing protein n=1 Tax=Ephemerocybe angulata TaxID=980116 RepID=A0A8H6HXL7_9AGAR|nr:hypothetical protein DFP72DRAFT_379531 [Tulosesus angulatus]
MGSFKQLDQHRVDKHGYCDFCKKYLGDRPSLRQHDVDEHGFCVFPECRTYFGTHMKLEQHEIEVHGLCTRSQCGRYLGTFKQLKQHRVDKHGYCETCEIYCDSHEGLQEHKIQVHGYCTVCRDFFPQLRYHRVHEHGYCSEPQCQKYLGSYERLQQHRRDAPQHFFCTGPYGPGCDPDHSYSSESNLREHRNSSIHVPLSVRCPFQCSTDRKFISVAALAAHYDANGCQSITRQQLNRRIFDIDNTRDRRTVVDGAESPVGEGLIRSSKIYQELETARESRDYTCRQKSDCGMRFNKYQQLEAHVKSPVHDPRIYRCRHCLTRFQNLSALAQHASNGFCGVNPLGVKKDIFVLVCAAAERDALTVGPVEYCVSAWVM